MNTREQKKIILGTALWGWGVDKKDAFELLDAYVDSGGTTVDTASNYPINGVASDCGKASQWLGEWIKQNPSVELSVLLKMGAVDNMGSSDTELTAIAVRDAVAHYQDVLTDKLSIVAVHWDNRDRASISAISETLNEFQALRRSGLEVGFSGVKHPQIYRELAPELSNDWWIQVKENALTRASRAHYSPHFPNARYLAYGINMGGVKSHSSQSGSSVALRGIHQPDELIEKISSFISDENVWDRAPKGIVEFSLALAMSNPNLAGIIIGPRDIGQLEHTLEFCKTVPSDGALYENICSGVPLYR